MQEPSGVSVEERELFNKINVSFLNVDSESNDWKWIIKRSACSFRGMYSYFFCLHKKEDILYVNKNRF